VSRAVPRFHRVNPALPAATGAVYNVIASGSGEAGIWLMNFGYMSASFAQTILSEPNLATSWCNNFAAGLRGLLSTVYFLSAVKVVCVSVPTRQPFLNTTNANLGAGTGGATPLPSVNAVVMSKGTLIRGQHGRGRNYFPGVPSSDVNPAVDPDRITPAAQAAYQAFANLMNTTPIVDGATNVAPAIFTRTRAGIPVTLAAGVATMRVSSILGSVRRRRLGRGK